MVDIGKSDSCIEFSMMSFTYKDLIDVAIGSPESGHVNFYALHVLLSNFAQKLELLDETVEQDDYLLANMRFQSSLSECIRVLHAANLSVSIALACLPLQSANRPGIGCTLAKMKSPPLRRRRSLLQLKQLRRQRRRQQRPRLRRQRRQQQRHLRPQRRLQRKPLRNLHSRQRSRWPHPHLHPSLHPLRQRRRRRRIWNR